MLNSGATRFNSSTPNTLPKVEVLVFLSDLITNFPCAPPVHIPSASNTLLQGTRWSPASSVPHVGGILDLPISWTPMLSKTSGERNLDNYFASSDLRFMERYLFASQLEFKSKNHTQNSHSRIRCREFVELMATRFEFRRSAANPLNVS